jgi:hypothetical protein
VPSSAAGRGPGLWAQVLSARLSSPGTFLDSHPSILDTLPLVDSHLPRARLDGSWSRAPGYWTPTGRVAGHSSGHFPRLSLVIFPSPLYGILSLPLIFPSSVVQFFFFFFCRKSADPPSEEEEKKVIIVFIIILFYLFYLIFIY